MLYSGYMLCASNLYSFFLLSSVSAALLRQATYGTIKIGIYQKIKRLFAEDIQRLYLKENYFISLYIFF